MTVSRPVHTLRKERNDGRDCCDRRRTYFEDRMEGETARRAGVSLVEAPLAARLHVHVLRAIAKALGTRTVDTGRVGLIP